MSSVIKADRVEPLAATVLPRREPQPAVPVSSTAPPEASEAESRADERERRRAEAEDILRSAQARAEQMIDRALEGAAQIADEARRSGFEQGRAEGLASVEAERAEALREIEALRREALAERDRLLLSAAEDAVRLAVHIARQIVGVELRFSEEAAVANVARALDRVRTAGRASVRVSLEDVASVERGSPLLAELRAAIRFDISADPALGRGDVIVETPSGRVDGRLGAQFERVERALVEAAEQAVVQDSDDENAREVP